MIAERNATTILRVPYTHKPYVHFYATQTLDFLVAGAVEEGPRTDPPASPVLGASYIVASAPSGAWTGQAQCVAGYTSGGWRFLSPTEGMSLYVKSNGVACELGALRGSSVIVGGLQVVGTRAAIAAPSGGTTVDAQARTALAQILAALRQHGLIET